MAITISTHNGSTVDLAHNRREKWRVDQENAKWAEKHPGELRIDLSKEHEILIDRGSLSQVYHELFDDAVEEFNQRQLAHGNKDRVIKNYLSEIKAEEGTRKSAKHPIYEMITTVGSKENPVEEEVAKAILKEHAEGFEKRNPNLYVVSQVWHADESGSWHIHISYIPVAYNLSRGMKTQNSLSKALAQQGINGDKYNHTAQMIWEKKENETLEAICKKYGFEVEHPQAGTKQEHLTVEEYKVQKSLEEKQEELETVKNLPLGTVVVKKGRLEQLEEIEKKYHEEMPVIEQSKRNLKAASETMVAYTKALKQFEEDKFRFDEKVNEVANRKVILLKDKAIEFIKEMGLWKKFEEFVAKSLIKLSKSVKKQ